MTPVAARLRLRALAALVQSAHRRRQWLERNRWCDEHDRLALANPKALWMPTTDDQVCGRLRPGARR